MIPLCVYIFIVNDTMTMMRYGCLFLALAIAYAASLSVRTSMSRRAAVMGFIGSSSAGAWAFPFTAQATPDCVQDCLKNCNLIAPKDPGYCKDNCVSYCEQEDRTDGLSGSVSSTGGETGILGSYTVPKGEDRPPQIKLPGLDFSSDSGKKLLGY